jgi:HTH-type transcriptional regulator / antitoxin HipB
MEDQVRKIGRMVRFHRKKAELTQLELAIMANIGKTSVFDIEKGKKSVQLDTLLAVLHVLNIKMEFQGPLMSRFDEYEKS